MKHLFRSPFILAVVTVLLVSCSNNSGSTKEVSKDTSEKKYDPAGYQKHSDTYDPKAAATDTMYKDRDSVPKAKQ